MPTGYTADIKDGISFQTYALNCARAFGACITLRDEGGGGEAIPDVFTPSDHFAEAAEKARTALAALELMTLAECQRAADKAWDDAETQRQAHLADNIAQRASYEAMLQKVNDWTPPTAEHEDFKRFMRAQIEESIRFDCMEEFYSKPTVRMTGCQWARSERGRLAREVSYHERHHQDEVLRAAGRTAWVRALRTSLPECDPS